VKVLNNLDLATNQLLNAKLQNLGSDLTAGAGNTSQIYYNTASNLAKISNGSSIDTLTNLLESVSGSGAISVSAISSKSQTISVAAATGSVPGTMSAADYNTLHGATSSNTASAIVQRDGSGNFSAGTITATLTGTASNATQLNGQAASYYLARANHTGTQLAATVSDFDTQVRTSRLDQMAAPTVSVSMNSVTITNVANPVNANDAANKAYVDASAAGYDTKASVRLATTAALPANTYSAGVLTASANAALTVDGVAVAAGDRILVKNEATAANNGIYVVTNAGSGAVAYVLTRSSDANANSGTGNAAINSGAFVFVEVGTNLQATAWEMITAAPITIGTTGLTWAQVGGPTTYTAGNGLTLVGSQFAAVGTASRITVSGSGIDIAATYVGQTSITTLGTITTGTWQGTAVAVANGGTGATTAGAARTNLGATTKFSQTLATSATSYTVTHSLGTQDVDIIVRELSTNSIVMVDAVATDTNNVTVTFATAPAANAYRVTVIG
jgi:hypothetical protein